jgi:dephospho-CoA kinase
MLKIGLTGGIGSGKSFVSNLFGKWGLYVFDADKRSKDILFKNETAQNEIIAEFGTDVLGLNKKIDNQKLANIAFQSEEYQMRLNAIMHPYIFKEIDNTISLISKTKKFDIFLVDAALIYESGYDIHMDYVVVVTSRLKLRTERALSSGKLDRDDFLRREMLQWPDQDKINMADFVIHNNGTKVELEQEAKRVFDKFI